MLTSAQKTGTLVIILILFLPIVLLQHKIDPMRHQFEPSITNVDEGVKQLPIEFALGALVGFREAIAGLLWVRTDQFFDQGDYDAVIPMVRIITWLDPHFLDVYETGAWHMDYNLTDYAERSDRRYIPYSVSLMKEGIANNPYETELYSDLAFTHYMHKIGDFPSALEWYSKAVNLHRIDPQTGKSVPVPYSLTIVGHGLAHAYLAVGDYKDAIAEWQRLIVLQKQAIAANKYDLADQFGLSAATLNLKETVNRAKWRGIQTKPPLNVHFHSDLVRLAPMDFVVSGTADIQGTTSPFDFKTGAHETGPVDGERVEIQVKDADYVMPRMAPFTMNMSVPANVTILQDSAVIRKGKFKRLFDMSKDHLGEDAMYSFTAPKYTVTLWLNPANPFTVDESVKDRIGWLGEGLTDDKYLDTSGVVPGTGGVQIPGLHMIKRVYTLTRDDIMGSGIKDFH